MYIYPNRRQAVLWAFLLGAGWAAPAAAENLFLEVVVPAGATVGPPSSFTVTMNLRDADNGNQIVPPSRIPGVPPNVAVSAAIGGGAGNGALSVASVALTSPTVSFQEAYTAAETINLKVSVNVGTTPVSGASALISFNPDVYVKVLVLLPGETARPQGNTTATGKTGAPSNQTVNIPFSVTEKAVDQYWNVVPAVTDMARLTSIPGGFVVGTSSKNFVSGVATFSIALSTPYFNMGVQADDADNGAITAQTSLVNVNGLYYFNVIVPSSATAGGPANYPVTIELRDTNTGNLVSNSAIPSPNPAVTLTTLESGVAGQGTTGVTSIPLSNNSITFNQTYTRAAVVTLRAQATVGGAVSGNSVPFTVVPSSYSQVLLLMPWDTARTPGVPSATGKTGSPPAFILAGALQSVTVRAVDPYWNIVTTATTAAQLDTVPSGFVAGQSSSAFANGIASFSVSIATTGNNVGIRASDANLGGIFPQAETVNVFPPGLHYELALATAVTMTPQTFTMQVLLKDGSENVATYAVNGFNLATVQTTPVSGVTLGTVSGTLAGGSALITTQTISRTGTFKITASDSNGFTGTSALIAALPENHRYQLVVPTSAVFGVPFSLQVQRIDNQSGAFVARSRTLTISAFFSDGTPLTAPASISTTSASMTLSPQSYSEIYSEPNQWVTSRLIYFLVQPNLDGDGLSSYSTLQATSAVVNILPGAPASLTLSVIAPLLTAGGQATLQSVVRDAPEGHRIPGQAIAFSVIAGSGTLSPALALADSSGSAKTVLQTNASTSPVYGVSASAGVLVTTVSLSLGVPPVTLLSLTGLSQTALNGTLLIKTDTQLSLNALSNIGISSIQYQLDGAPFVPYAGPFTLSLGQHLLNYLSTDLIGQNSPTGSAVLQVAAEGTVPGKLVNYPNPFQAGKQQTTLEYNLPSPSDVRLRILTGTGELVFDKTFPQGSAGTAAGVNQYLWDGRNGAGYLVGNGVYHAVLDSSSGRLDRTIVVVK